MLSGCPVGGRRCATAMKIPVLVLFTRGRKVDVPVKWKNYIASEHEILRGKPRVKGTRIPVSLRGVLR